MYLLDAVFNTDSYQICIYNNIRLLCLVYIECSPSASVSVFIITAAAADTPIVVAVAAEPDV